MAQICSVTSEKLCNLLLWLCACMCKKKKSSHTHKWFALVLNDTCMQMRCSAILRVHSHTGLCVFDVQKILLNVHVCVTIASPPLQVWVTGEGAAGRSIHGCCNILSFWSSTQSNFKPSWTHWPSLYDWAVITCHTALWLDRRHSRNKAGLRLTS